MAVRRREKRKGGRKTEFGITLLITPEARCQTDLLGVKMVGNIRRKTIMSLDGEAWHR